MWPKRGKRTARTNEVLESSARSKHLDRLVELSEEINHSAAEVKVIVGHLRENQGGKYRAERPGRV